MRNSRMKAKEVWVRAGQRHDTGCGETRHLPGWKPMEGADTVCIRRILAFIVSKQKKETLEGGDELGVPLLRDKI